MLLCTTFSTELLGEITVMHSHSTVMLRELLARPCSFSARQRYCPSPCGVIAMISSTDSSSAVMVPTSSPSFSQVRVGAGLPWVLQCKASEVPSSTVMELFTRGSRGGSAAKSREIQGGFFLILFRFRKCLYIIHTIKNTQYNVLSFQGTKFG